jgi:hypothetical protein
MVVDPGDVYIWQQDVATIKMSYQVMGTWIYCWLYYIRGQRYPR